MAAKNGKRYRPSDKESFMNKRQRTYFRNKLLYWKDDILRENRETLQHLQGLPVPSNCMRSPFISLPAAARGAPLLQQATRKGQ